MWRADKFLEQHRRAKDWRQAVIATMAIMAACRICIVGVWKSVMRWNLPNLQQGGLIVIAATTMASAALLYASKKMSLVLNTNANDCSMFAFTGTPNLFLSFEYKQI